MEAAELSDCCSPCAAFLTAGIKGTCNNISGLAVGSSPKVEPHILCSPAVGLHRIRLSTMHCKMHGQTSSVPRHRQDYRELQ